MVSSSSSSFSSSSPSSSSTATSVTRKTTNNISSNNDGKRLPAPKLNKWGEMCAGAFAGGISRFLIAPLDVLKIRFQLQVEPISSSVSSSLSSRTIPSSLSSSLSPTASSSVVSSVSYSSATSSSSNSPGGGLPPMYRSMGQAIRALLAEEGIKTLWRGNGAAMVLWITYMGIQFPSYRAAQQVLKNYNNTSSSSSSSTTSISTSTVNPPNQVINNLIAGAFGGCFATLFTYPLDWLRTRMASQGVPPQYRTMGECIQKVYQINGIRGFFQGLVPTLIQIGPSLAVTFTMYEQMTIVWDNYVIPWVDHASSSSSSSSQTIMIKQFKSLICGAVSGTIGKLAVYPLDTVKKRLQAMGMKRDVKYGQHKSYTGVINALVTISKEEGIIRGLYKGTAPSLIKAAAAAALSFWAYETAVTVLQAVPWAIEAETIKDTS